MAQITLTIEVDDAATDADIGQMKGVRSSVFVDAVLEDMQTWLILAALEAHQRDVYRRELEEKNPMLSEVIAAQIVAPNARLALVDAVMHLPMVPSTGTISPF